jgi:hypothetical protein
MDSNFQYRGDLAETALPEILYTIDRFQVPGVIAASRGGIVKQVFIREGRVVHATSSDRDDSLGSFLQKSGVLTAEAYQETMRERERTNKRYGALLVENGVLSPSEIYSGIRKQIESIVWSLFYWQDGEVTFSIGDFRETDAVRIQLPMCQVVFQGIKRAPNAKTLVSRLGRKETLFEPCYRTEELIETALESADMKLLSLVNGKRTLYDICTQGPHSPAENGKVLYALQVLRLVKSVGVAAIAGVAGVAEELEEPRPREEATGAIKIRFKTEGGRFGS